MKASYVFPLFILSLLVGCKASVISHDENKAALQAVRFAEVAFVTRDFDQAYTMFVPDLQKRLSPVDFRAAVDKLHPDGFPSELEATDFEPIPGQEAMEIFITGSNGSKIFHYRFTMFGTSTTGYRVAGMYRNSAPYSKAPLRQKLSSPGGAS